MTEPLTMVIPWRPGTDPHRIANLEFIRDAYTAAGVTVIVSDDGKTTGPFNRSAAFNRGMAQTDADVIIWNEADCLIPLQQLQEGAQEATRALGLVLPYTDRVELTQAATERFRAHPEAFRLEEGDIEVHYEGGKSIGQCGITSRATMQAIGGQWDEGFSGWGYDDNAMFWIFGILAGEPRWISAYAPWPATTDGPTIGLHLWHPPAYTAPSPEQAAQTEANRARYEALLAERDPDRLRALLRDTPKEGA